MRIMCWAEDADDRERERVLYTVSSSPSDHPLSWRAGHFRNEHFACDHPHCLEARFVVFSNEQELKQHRLREHNEQLSRNERRAALQIPVNLTVCAFVFPSPQSWQPSALEPCTSHDLTKRPAGCAPPMICLRHCSACAGNRLDVPSEPPSAV